MGYHITLSRPQPSSGISEPEWRHFIASRPELKMLNEEGHFITAILDGDHNLALHHSTGSASIFTKNPEGPRIIEYMASIAPHFGAVVSDDEGNIFTSEGDWGTQRDWDIASEADISSRKAAERPRWKQDLSRGKRVIAGLLLGVVIIIIKEVFFFP